LISSTLFFFRSNTASFLGSRLLLMSRHRVLLFQVLPLSYLLRNLQYTGLTPGRFARDHSISPFVARWHEDLISLHSSDVLAIACLSIRTNAAPTRTTQVTTKESGLASDMSFKLLRGHFLCHEEEQKAENEYVVAWQWGTQPSKYRTIELIVNLYP